MGDDSCLVFNLFFILVYMYFFVKLFREKGLSLNFLEFLFFCVLYLLRFLGDYVISCCKE